MEKKEDKSWDKWSSVDDANTIIIITKPENYHTLTNQFLSSLDYNDAGWQQQHQEKQLTTPEIITLKSRTISAESGCWNI